jgi:hypothetical protein
MSDLTHWNYEEVFTAHEVACLMLGLEPNETLEQDSRVLPVRRRIDRITYVSHRMAAAVLLSYYPSLEEFELKPDGEALFSELLHEYYSNYPREQIVFSARPRDGESRDQLWCRIVESPEYEKIYVELLDYFRKAVRDDDYTYKREDVVQWLRYTAYKSVYEFDFDPIADAYRRYLENENPSPSAKKSEVSAELGQREKSSFLNIIAALLELTLNPRPGRDSQAKLIQELIDNYSDKHGLSKSNLEKCFAEAKRSLS